MLFRSFFLSTLTPVLNVSRGCYLTNANIRAANDVIRSLASQDAVTLVDSWAAFTGHETAYLLGDGLHPTIAGQQAIAAAFFDAIKAKLEVPASAGAPARTSSSATAPATSRGWRR